MINRERRTFFQSFRLGSGIGGVLGGVFGMMLAVPLHAPAWLLVSCLVYGILGVGIIWVES